MTTQHERDLETGLDYRGARFYDADICRFLSLDPLAADFPELSDYVYVADNPIKFIDPDGRKIEDPDNIVADFKTSITNMIKAVDLQLSNPNLQLGNYTDEQLNNFKNDLNQILTELEEMDKSTQLYKVGYNDEMSEKEGSVTFDNSDNSVKIEVGNGAKNGVKSQELLHGYQFETGKLSISYDNSSYGILYDITDETATYKREHLVENGIFGYETGKKINDDWTVAHGATATPPAYQNLPRNARDMKSHGFYMKMMNEQRKKSVLIKAPMKDVYIQNNTPKEVYKDWDKEEN